MYVWLSSGSGWFDDVSLVNFPLVVFLMFSMMWIYIPHYFPDGFRNFLSAIRSSGSSAVVQERKILQTGLILPSSCSVKQIQQLYKFYFFKLRLGLSVCLSVCRSVGPPKLQKKNDDFVKEAPAYCRSFLDGLDTWKEGGNPCFIIVECFEMF